MGKTRNIGIKKGLSEERISPSLFLGSDYTENII
jgi:hypothetical protein